MRFAAEPWREIGVLRIRAGLHAGEAEFRASPGTPEGDYFGPPVNCTARVMSATWGGQIPLTPEVTQASPLPEQATLLDLGRHLLKNVSAPQQLYQLDHPQLPWHEFPPPRTLSGQSIRQAVEERGGQMAGLEPQATLIALLSDTLLPALRGELDPESGALEGNLGVLEELGAFSLRGFVAGFADRLRAGRALPAVEVQAVLQRDLQAQWQAGGESALALRADASRLLTTSGQDDIGAEDNTIRVWDANTGEELLVLRGHASQVFLGDWSPDGRRIVSSSSGSTTRIWNEETGDGLLTLSTPAFYAPYARWSRDGKYVAVAMEATPTEIWRVWQSTEELVNYTKECCLFRELTTAERERFALPPR